MKRNLVGWLCVQTSGQVMLMDVGAIPPSCGATVAAQLVIAG